MQSRTVSAVHKKTLKLALGQTAFIHSSRTADPWDPPGLHKTIQDPRFAPNSSDHASKHGCFQRGALPQLLSLSPHKDQFYP